MKETSYLNVSNNSLLNNFSHIYVEKDAYNFTATYEILEKFQKSKVITIDKYRDLFNRPKQNFLLQKQSQKMVLAVKNNGFLYQGPNICEHFGFKNFYYCSSVINCIYNCDYCFLQGMYNSGNILVFVNLDDFFKAVDDMTTDKKVYLCVSYDSDILALENIIGHASNWIKYASANKNLIIEIKTKSANYHLISEFEPIKNVILAWTLSPDQIWQRYEHGTPSIDSRIKCVQSALQDGWNVRISIEPVLQVNDWENIYSEFVDKVFGQIDADALLDINSGVFRMSRQHADRIKKARWDVDIFAYQMFNQGGIITYLPDKQEYMRQCMRKYLLKYCREEKIFIYENGSC